MAEMKYEHPLEYYTVDNFIKESRKMIGTPLAGMPGTSDQAKYDFMAAYVMALGDDNRIYSDLEYAVATKYDTLIGTPTFLVTVKYPVCVGALYDGPYPLIGVEGEFEWEWNDVTKMGDKFSTELVLKDVIEKPGEKGRTVNLVSECKYWNKMSKELVASCSGTYAAVARANSITEIPDAALEGFRKQPLTDRKVYHYSEAEIKRIIDDYFSMTRRGDKPLYWEDVKVGDKLNQVVKVPLTTGYIVNYINATFTAAAYPNFELHLNKWMKSPGALKGNPTTGWPFDIEISQHVDPYMSEAGGMPHEYGWGLLEAGFCTHLLSNWMSDEGFIRSLKVNTIEPYIYGDALWLNGQVVEKYKERLGGAMYKAVDIKLEAVNQLKQKVVTGTATVYLPSVNATVELPVPQNT